MPTRLPIPSHVKEAIREHIRAVADKAPEIYKSASEDEDTVTGDFGGQWRTGWRTLEFVDDDIRQTWSWSCTYYKFRGRGRGAPEKYLGADGIFELSLNLQGQPHVKSLLFQAKKDGAGGPKLVEQALKLSTWREAAFVLNYAKDSFSAVLLDDVIAERGGANTASYGIPLDAFLGGHFLDCDIGDLDLKYDAQKSTLRWRTESGELVTMKLRAKHRFGIKIRAHKAGHGANASEPEVTPETLHRFRMWSSPEDRFALATLARAATEKAARRRLMLAYHPDRLSDLSHELRKLAEARTAEFNTIPSRRR